MEDPEDRGPAQALRFREAEPAAASLVNKWGADRRPLVYATYGSVVPSLPGFGELFRDTVAVLGELPVRALFTVGTEVELEALGPVPAVIVPGIADQFHNAARVAALGAGIALGGAAEVRAGLAGAVRRLLDEPAYRVAARRVAAEVAALPRVDEVPSALGEWLRPARAA